MTKPKKTNGCQSVDWVPNVICPECGSARCYTRRTCPIEKGDTVRLRYHKCLEKRCGESFKSVQDLSIS